MKQINIRLTDAEHTALVTLSASVKMTAPAYVLAVMREELTQATVGGSVYADTLRCEHIGCSELREGRSNYCLPHALIPRCSESWCARPVAARGDTCDGDHTEDDEL